MKQPNAPAGVALVVIVLATVALACAPERPAPVSPRPSAATADTLQEKRDRAVAMVLEWIAGRENEPAGEVFENVELLGSIPAGRFVRIMDVGFARSLGVTCDHCHVADDWSSDDERPKRAAREMWRMVGRLNGELLPSLTELEGEATVNCTTCHRGRVVPATSMP